MRIVSPEVKLSPGGAAGIAIGGGANAGLTEPRATGAAIGAGLLRNALFPAEFATLQTGAAREALMDDWLMILSPMRRMSASLSG